ncbi:class I SAM-dependent methyltransferase [Leucobacter zeae]|nr:class I SAM-dependent methyltransferase [Leucobacter zeae]
MPVDPVAPVRESYDRMSDRYIELLGRVDLMHVDDRRRILEWASGPANDAAVSAEPPERAPRAGYLDLGCGPGHWTDALQRAGLQVSGIDLSPAFIASARREFPDVDFEVGDARSLHYESGALEGVLAWFSLIHTPPRDLPPLLDEIARVLAVGGRLLVGFFSGEELKRFDHAVAPAWFWPPHALAGELEAAGFEIVDLEERREPGERAVASLSASRR